MVWQGGGVSHLTNRATQREWLGGGVHGYQQQRCIAYRLWRVDNERERGEWKRAIERIGRDDKKRRKSAYGNFPKGGLSVFHEEEDSISFLF